MNDSQRTNKCDVILDVIFDMNSFSTSGSLFKEFGCYCLLVSFSGSLNYYWLTQNTEF